MEGNPVFYTIILHYTDRPRQRLIYHFYDGNKENVRNTITDQASKKSNGALYAVDIWATPPWDDDLAVYKSKNNL
jgi:hypothetical protein